MGPNDCSDKEKSHHFENYFQEVFAKYAEYMLPYYIPSFPQELA